jgi:hypothetical protein
VIVAQAPGAFGLHAERGVALERGLRDAVIFEISHRIGREVQAGIAREARDLEIEIPGRVQVAQDSVVGDLALGFVELCAVETGIAVHGEAGRLPRIVGYFEMVVRNARYERHAAVGVEDVLEIAEAVILRRAVVDGRGAPVGGLDADAVVQVIAGDEIVEVPGIAAVIDAGLDRVVAAAVDRHFAARLKLAAFGLHIDHGAGDETVFGGQRAGDELHRRREARIERLAEDADTFGDDDAVETVLQRIVLAADVELPETVLRDAGRLQDHLVEQVVLAAGRVLDILLRERIGRSARLRLDGVARRVEPLGGDDDDFAL